MYYPLELHHNRFDHTLVVAKTLEVIMRQNGFAAAEINLAIAAAVLHDIATPPLGEGTKAIDPKNLHEEDHWWEVLDDEAKAFLGKLGTTREQIDTIIKNQGVVGQLLDIADRITYVMKDLFALVPKLPFEPSHDTFIENLNAILVQDPQIGNIYQDVRVDHARQTVYFTDPERLGRFLELRALLHQGLYLHPFNQGRDLLWTKLIQPFYTPEEPAEADRLTQSQLRRMTDTELIDYLSSRLGLKDTPLGLWYDIKDWYPRQYERFPDHASAQAREAQLWQDPQLTILGIKEVNGFNPATTYLVKGTDNTLSQFRHFDPEKARELEALAQSTQGFYLYYSLNAEETAPLPRTVTS